MPQIRPYAPLVAVVFAAFAACADPAVPPPNTPLQPTIDASAPPAVADASAGASATPADAGAPVAKADAAPPVTPQGRMLPTVKTTFESKLKALGLDPKNLPTLAKMDPTKRRLVMDYIAESTGLDCTDCHASEEDFKAMTPRKAIAKHMWDDWTRGLVTTEGGPVFCDSCHQGSPRILDHSDTPKIAKWMKENLVGKLARKDKKKHACEGCHGEPFDSNFLEKWRKGT